MCNGKSKHRLRQGIYIQVNFSSELYLENGNFCQEDMVVGSCSFSLYLGLECIIYLLQITDVRVSFEF